MVLIKNNGKILYVLRDTITDSFIDYKTELQHQFPQSILDQAKRFDSGRPTIDFNLMWIHSDNVSNPNDCAQYNFEEWTKIISTWCIYADRAIVRDSLNQKVDGKKIVNTWEIIPFGSNDKKIDGNNIEFIYYHSIPIKNF